MRRSIVPLSIVLLLVLTICAGGQAGTSPARAQGPAATRSALPLQLVIIKRFGAALRMQPSSSAAIVMVMECGSRVGVSGASAGWYHVYAGRYAGWVGGARVADAQNPPAYDCTDSYTFQMGNHVYSYVRTGCLSLRVQPSRNAAYHHCVSNHHDYVVTNGPIEVAGEDWFGVTSPSTGSGWSLAQYLYPYFRN
jgi:hypothetical protein